MRWNIAEMSVSHGARKHPDDILQRMGEERAAGRKDSRHAGYHHQERQDVAVRAPLKPGLQHEHTQPREVE